MTVSTDELGWLLDRFADRAPGAAHAVVVSADGLFLASTRGLPRDRGEQLSAIVSGLASPLVAVTTTPKGRAAGLSVGPTATSMDIVGCRSWSTST